MNLSEDNLSAKVICYEEYYIESQDVQLATRGKWVLMIIS